MDQLIQRCLDLFGIVSNGGGEVLTTEQCMWMAKTEDQQVEVGPILNDSNAVKQLVDYLSGHLVRVQLNGLLEFTPARPKFNDNGLRIHTHVGGYLAIT
jgi:hypothetical protein